MLLLPEATFNTLAVIFLSQDAAFRFDLSPRVVTSIEKPSCGVVGYKPGPLLTRSRKCRLVDCWELCSVITGRQSYSESSARCLLLSSPAAEGSQQVSTSPYTLYDFGYSMTTSSTTEPLPEATNSANTGLSTSGTEVAATSDAQPSSTAATFTTELSRELASASTSLFSEPITATTTGLTTDAESASASVSSDATSTAIIPSSNTEMTTTGEATTTTAGEPTTASSSVPTGYVIRMVNPDEFTFGYVSNSLDHNRSYGSRKDALEIQISAPEPGATSQLDFVHAEIFGHQNSYNSLSACTSTGSLTVEGPPGSPPANVYHAWSNWAALNRYTLAAESAIWNVDPDTLEVTAWINTDGCG
ncbi:hypothetical protein FDENT_1203 [Fusarium denticulatum]|uniref:Apple domain-containing protein n=1 Tax=Fusarium denticulatum TaxID=48507 RepID=A0A8H5XIX6_9HYPO|nr:hypothetical protein FDENT_1203 [Fusarium denticulatum]